MKKIEMIALFTFSLVLCALSHAQEQIPDPVFQEGDFWQFKVREWDYIGSSSDALNGVYELVYTQGQFKLFSVTGEQKEELKPHVALLSMVAGSENSLRFPLSTGHSWSYSYQTKLRGGQKTYSRTVEVRVSGIEQITTPAGTFKSLKLEKSDRGATADSLWVTTYYYGTEARSIIKSFYDSSAGTGRGGKRKIELIKFGSVR